MSLAARAARPSSSSPRPSCPTSPGTALTRRATSAAKPSPSSLAQAVEAVVPDDLAGQPGGGIRPPAGANQYGDLGLGDAAQDAFDQRSAQKSGGTGDEEALSTEVPADRHGNCLPSIAESVYHLVSEHAGDPDVLSTSDRILNAALASFASRGYDGHLARRPGQGPRAHQAEHPLLVPLQGRGARGGYCAQRRRPVRCPRDRPARRRRRLGPGRSGGPLGLPPGGTPARTARTAAGGIEVGPAGGDPDDAGARAPGAASVGLPGG